MNNILEFEARATVERQAREWLIKLDGDVPLTEAEQAALSEWMDRHPSHREELTRLSKFWSQANVLTELAVPLRPVTAGRRVRRLYKKPLLLAASIVLSVIALMAWRLEYADARANGLYATAVGEQRTIPLPDGSSIQLNTDSQVDVGYSESSREIHLLRGEALFSVSHDSKRAFDVYAAQSMVRAVGTAFSVRIANQEVSVTVAKGVVEIADVGRGPVIDGKAPARNLGALKAGQTTTLGSTPDHIDVHDLAEPELNRRMSWREGYLIFSGEPLSEVVAQVNRYSPVMLQIADPQLESIAVGGRFRIGDLDAVLDVLHANFGIRSTRIDPRNIRLDAARPH